MAVAFSWCCLLVAKTAAAEASSDSFFVAVAEALRESFAVVASFLVVAVPSSMSSCRAWQLRLAVCSGPATTGAGCD